MNTALNRAIVSILHVVMSPNFSPARITRTAVFAAFCLAIFSAAPPRSVQRGRAHIASEGSVGLPLDRATARATVRRELLARSAGTYIGEMLAERDSSLSRWPDLGSDSLSVWVQPPDAENFSTSYEQDVREAFQKWNDVRLPVRFSFSRDSSAADIHVSFIYSFEEEISGRTKWTRDDNWWITEGDIVLASHHRDGAVLDDDSMRAMALHEIGHLIGLDHTGDASNVMAAKVRVRSLSRADRATARLLYTLPPGGVR